MKKAIIWALVAGFMGTAQFAWAEANFAAKSVKSSTEKKAAAKKEAPSEDLGQQELRTKKQKELDGSRWSVSLASRGEEYGKSGKKDVLIFENQLVAFESFQKEGFGPSAYSLVVKADQAGGSWETNQRGPKGLLSIRGDWSGEVMNGVMSLEEGSGEDKKVTVYNFSSQEKKLIPQEAPSSDVLSMNPEPASTKALVSTEAQSVADKGI